MKNFRREIDILGNINNSNIIKLYKVIEGKNTVKEKKK